MFRLECLLMILANYQIAMSCYAMLPFQRPSAQNPLRTCLCRAVMKESDSSRDSDSKVCGLLHLPGTALIRNISKVFFLSRGLEVDQ